MRLKLGAVAMAAVVLGLVSAPAEAARLSVSVRWVWLPGVAEPVPFQDIVYDGATGEANNVTVAGLRDRIGAVFADPGNPIRTPLTVPTVDPLNATVYASWMCTSLRTSLATCEATPGSACTSANCSAPDVQSFNGRIKVAGNDGDDTIAILPSKFNSVVWGVFGDDTITVLNGRIDDVSCGAGTDSVTADVEDLVAADCESVSRG